MAILQEAESTMQKFLNEDDQSLLMVGSSDGVLKVYRNYHNPAEVKVITASELSQN